MQDIADKVGVSKALVSLVFRNAAGPSAETRQRVLAAADELGYRVNRNAALMTARRTHHLGITINIRNSFHTEIAEHIVAAADRFGL
jgi:LacI family transcriptional regulator